MREVDQTDDAARLVHRLMDGVIHAETMRLWERTDRLIALWMRACGRWQRRAADGTVFPAAVQLGLLSSGMHAVLMRGLHGGRVTDDDVAFLLPELLVYAMQTEQPDESWSHVVERYLAELDAQIAAEANR